MKLKTLCRSFALFVSFGFAGAACEAGGTTDNTMPNGPTPADLDDPGTATLAISFLPMGPTDTRCGTAAGVRVQVSDGAGDVQTCNAEWAPAEHGGQKVADCFFVLHPGAWQIQEVAVVDANNRALSCCVGDFPASVTVNESTTTEFGAGFMCETVSNGALDIYATVNRPPTINDLDIVPSKFGNTCEIIALDATASDPDGDGVTYAFGVMDSPKGGDWAVATRGNVGYFVGTGLGTYTVRLVVADDFQATHYLDFPIHLSGAATCDADDRLEELLP